ARSVAIAPRWRPGRPRPALTSPACGRRGRPPAPQGRGPPPMRIRDWPGHERPREKLLARGPGVLSDAELLAIFLGSGLRGQDAVATARQLLERHGPLRRLLELEPAAMARLPGLGPARACCLAAALELGNRWLAAGLERGQALTDPGSAGRYFARRLRPQPVEVFAALFLDTR